VERFLFKINKLEISKNSAKIAFTIINPMSFQLTTEDKIDLFQMAYNAVDRDFAFKLS